MALKHFKFFQRGSTVNLHSWNQTLTSFKIAYQQRQISYNEVKNAKPFEAFLQAEFIAVRVHSWSHQLLIKLTI